MSQPVEHVQDAHLLEADGIVYLYQLTTKDNTVIYFKADDTVTWQSHSYTGTAVQLDERRQSTDGQLSRPKMTLANPLAIFSPMVASGKLDNAVVVEKKVLRAHIDANVNIFQQHTWKVRRVPSLNNQSMVLELRDTLDGPRFLLPARQFMAPDFPTVHV